MKFLPVGVGFVSKVKMLSLNFVSNAVRGVFFVQVVQYLQILKNYNIFFLFVKFVYFIEMGEVFGR